MNAWLDKMLAPLDAIARDFNKAMTFRWWVWPAFLVGVALLTWVSALTVEPRPDEWTYLWGERLGDTCAWIQLTGQPCPSCGMTRSFAHAARLHFGQSWWYNPGGLTLFFWITAAGFVGAVRLITRDPEKLRPPPNVLMTWVLSWAFGLYALPWVLRLWGINPLP